MARPLLAAAAVCTIIALACSDGGESPPPEPAATATISAACSPARVRAAGETRETIMLNGIEREYLLHVPSTYDGSAAAGVVIALHALGSSAEALRDMTALADAADARAMFTVLPEGTGAEPGWNADQLENRPDDVAFLEAIVNALEDDLCIDSARIYATGYSNGGAMALRLACTAEGLLAAVAPVAAPFPSCQGDAPMIAFHGSADLVVPYEGGVAPGSTLPLLPVHRAASEWARGLGCDGLPTISRAAEDIEISTYGNCLAGDEALLYTVINGGHTWPGAAIDLDASLAGRTTHTISANDLILDFFDAHGSAR